MNLDRYRQVKWLKGGRDFPELDCYGVVNEVRKDLGLPLWPEYAGITKDNGFASVAADRAASAKPVTPSAGSVAFCYSGSLVSHVAVVVAVDGRLQALESNPKRNVTIIPLARLERRFTRVEYYS